MAPAPRKKTLLPTVAFLASGFFLQACSEINDSWEVKGGGYLKYSIEGAKNREIELHERDVEIPFINNSHHYFFFKTRVDESSHSDQFAIMVNRPLLGENQVVQQYSWVSLETTPHAVVFADSSIVTFDQKDDSTWTANLKLSIQDCRSGECIDTLPRLHINGRFRYWIPEDER